MRLVHAGRRQPFQASGEPLTHCIEDVGDVFFGGVGADEAEAGDGFIEAGGAGFGGSDKGEAGFMIAVGPFPVIVGSPADAAEEDAREAGRAN